MPVSIVQDQVAGVTVHELKSHPEPFQSVLEHVKRFEWRRDDRTPRFEVGDILLLREWDPSTGLYSGRKLAFRVNYIVRGPAFQVPEGFCIMSIERRWEGSPKESNP